MSETLRSFLTGTSGLAILAAVSAWLVYDRQPNRSPGAVKLPIRAAAYAILLQLAHFLEETTAGFYDRFPAFLGLAPWPALFFVAFNFLWLVVWTASLWGIAAGIRLAWFPLWFLALASMANGVVHLILAAASGGYFPGLATSPLVGVAGVVLTRRMIEATASARS